PSSVMVLATGSERRTEREQINDLPSAVKARPRRLYPSPIVRSQISCWLLVSQQRTCPERALAAASQRPSGESTSWRGSRGAGVRQVILRLPQSTRAISSAPATAT